MGRKAKSIKDDRPFLVPITEHLGLARYWASKYENTYGRKRNRQAILDSEHYAIACIGLMKASRTYDASRGTTFSTYASYCIKTELSHFAESEQKRRQLFICDTDLENDKWSICASAPDYRKESPVEAAITDDNSETVHRALSLLDARSKDFVVRHVLHKETCLSIAKSCSPPVSKQLVHDICKKALMKLAKILGRHVT